MTPFEAYGPAICVLAIWGLMMIGLSMLSTRGLRPEDRSESGHPKRDYSNPAYRRHRAFQNAIETSPAFLSTALAAILAGTSPILVNILAGVFLISRIVMAVVHIQTENQPLRSAAFGFGWLMIIFLALGALYAALI
ncbi:MAG: MAPEG family protein [Pseudomonadota bacterium]